MSARDASNVILAGSLLPCAFSLHLARDVVFARVASPILRPFPEAAMPKVPVFTLAALGVVAAATVTMGQAPALPEGQADKARS